ncbi:NO-inducible flavohemoprotein [Photobacterium alginatilyticum]|uniref:Flavohemoprotein n=1 Tax=Photobacterium alginatilyticum TaxID=1775171 RepID=A0ABW9YBN6_9GAMM|nr:NO-inducible flavohemoprotein [Photobacterium alginatilyticum]NBI51209.1 NO-inducible flavohemoprotein [Photobacterium alginatilyticum]
MLNAKTIEIVKTTAPLLEETGPKLTAHFYERMFIHNPELKNIFNMSNQRNGDQREALFNAIITYAKNIDNLPALHEAVEKIAHKHTSFQITKNQYQIVGRHLLASIDDFFSPGQEVIDAWEEAYGVLANIFIEREEQLYQENENLAGGWRGLREFELIEKRSESENICSFVFKPVDGKPVSAFKPGQYLGIYIQSDKLEFQEIRQYSLSSSVQDSTYRISVKRESGGLVSNYLHDELNLGDTVKLTSPAGDFFMEVEENTPVVLVSAGVGLTPTFSMLETLKDHKAPVTWVHATENGKQHAFKQHVNQIVDANDNMNSLVWYNTPTEEDCIGDDYHFSGFVDLNEFEDAVKRDKVQIYFCGPVGFMQHIARQLVELGVPRKQFHYECFGPHKIV